MDETVRRLMSDRSVIAKLKESIRTREDLNEEDEEEEDIVLDGEYEDSGEERDEEYSGSSSSGTHTSLSRRTSSPPEPEEEEIPEEPPASKKSTAPKSPNPLDNPYAVNFKLGDTVVVTSSNGNPTTIEAAIEGYDPDGFYRLKMKDGSTINGLTDAALSTIANSIKESVCVCGSSKFIREGDSVICDRCGRRITEGLDQLTKLDKSRPKSRRVIRSDAHPVSTATKPSVEESIKSALKSKK